MEKALIIETLKKPSSGRKIIFSIFGVIFGYIGFILRRLDWPLVPIVLGLVLGSIILERLTAGAGQIKTALDLINRPVSGTLFVVILMVMGFIILTSIRNRRKHFQ